MVALEAAAVLPYDMSGEWQGRFCNGRKWHGNEMAQDCVYSLPYTPSAPPDSMFQGEQVGKSCFLV